MPFQDMPVFGLLKSRMRFLETRQKLIAENVANAETPGYRTHDVRDPSFREMVSTARGDAGQGLAVTNARHIPAANAGDGGRFDARRTTSFETTPDGNAVSLEDEMMKSAETTQEYQVATMLYTKSLAILRMAATRR